MNAMDNVFVIGDTHGNLDRLEALLRQEGFVVRCEECDGAGLVPEFCGRYEHENVCDCEVDCGTCDGEGWARAREDVTIVHLGDLGHFGSGGSPTGDVLCYKYVTQNRWCDVVLWGNHDRAAVDGAHHATDFLQVHEALHYIRKLWEQGRMQVAFAAHGFLITHAGLAAAFKQQTIPDTVDRDDPQEVADWLNDQDEVFLEHDNVFADSEPQADPSAVAIINAIGRKRGGRVATGGILWRDIDEKLFQGFRQIFGHSADPEHQIRFCWGDGYTRRSEAVIDPKGGLSYCIDIGGKGNGDGNVCLAGIYLPSEKLVRVDL